MADTSTNPEGDAAGIKKDEGLMAYLERVGAQRVCLLMIDEDIVPKNNPKNNTGALRQAREQKQAAQSQLSRALLGKEWPTYVCAMIQPGGYDLSDALIDEIDDEDRNRFPGATQNFKKFTSQQNALVCERLRAAVQGCDFVIIGGQSTNACCAATARAAGAMGMQVVTSPMILRGGMTGAGDDQPKLSHGEMSEGMIANPSGFDGEFSVGWPKDTVIASKL